MHVIRRALMISHHARRYSSPFLLLVVLASLLLTACTGGTPAAPTPAATALATAAATAPATLAPAPSVAASEEASAVPPPAAGGPRVALQSGDAILLADAQGQTERLTDRGEFGFDPSGAGPIGGSARFSPDGTQVAFAAARGNPDDEQGWVLVGSSQGGTARLVATAPSGQHFAVMDWLDDATLVLQTFGETPAVWLVPAAGGEPQTIAGGVFLAVMPGRAP